MKLPGFHGLTIIQPQETFITTTTTTSFSGYSSPKLTLRRANKHCRGFTLTLVYLTWLNVQGGFVALNAV